MAIKEHIEVEELKKITKSLMLDENDPKVISVLENISHNWNFFQDTCNKIIDFSVDSDTKPTDFCVATPCKKLRDDVIVQSTSVNELQEKFVKNEDGFNVIEKNHVK